MCKRLAARGGSEKVLSRRTFFIDMNGSLLIGQ